VWDDVGGTTGFWGDDDAGATVESCGLRDQDQMAHFAILGLEVGWADSCAVDIEPM